MSDPLATFLTQRATANHCAWMHEDLPARALSRLAPNPVAQRAPDVKQANPRQGGGSLGPLFPFYPLAILPLPVVLLSYGVQRPKLQVAFALHFWNNALPAT